MGALLQTVWGIIVGLCGVIVGLPAPAPTAADPVAMVVPCQHAPPLGLLGTTPEESNPDERGS